MKKRLRILVTGGPVHAHLDSVKIIMNGFRGGRMAGLARKLAEQGHTVIYLTSRHGAIPENPEEFSGGLDVRRHNGFWDYMEQVKAICKPGRQDAVVLGAAVCNLIPQEPWTGKFPSHNYKPGDSIPINFEIAPRVIDVVKRVDPTTNLFGFKLLDGVPQKELIDAAYGVLLESGAVTVFANDRQDLNTKFAVNKEGGYVKIFERDLVACIEERASDKYYSTEITTDRLPKDVARDCGIRFRQAVTDFGGQIEALNDSHGKDLLLGTIAIRLRRGTNQFITTVRGKEDLSKWTLVRSVDNVRRLVKVWGDKPTLNAPLLFRAFKLNPDINLIVHVHGSPSESSNPLPYAPAGTKADTMRPEKDIKGTFHVQAHGSFFLKEADGWVHP